MGRLTPENETMARRVVARYPIGRSALIPLLHLAQAQDGWVSPEAMEQIGDMVGLTPAEVLSTCSFYEMFKRAQVGRYLVGICTNIACMLCGADELLGHAQRRLGVRPGGTTADGLFSLEEAQCLAGCGAPPCVQVNYRYVDASTPARFDTLLADLESGHLDGEIPPHGVLCRTPVPEPVGEPTPVESLALRERH